MSIDKTAKGQPWEGLFEGLHHFRCPAGNVLFVQGEQPAELIYIVSGVVKVIRSNAPDGSRDMVVALRRARSLLGLEEAILDEPHPVTAVTLVPSVMCPIPSERFRTVWNGEPTLHQAIANYLAAEGMEQVKRSGWTTLDVAERLRELLKQLAGCYGRDLPDRSMRLQLHLTQQDLADLIGTSRESVNRRLVELQRAGVVYRLRGWLVIPNSSELLR
jgi:CRP/FNR family transcriptional regulator